MPLTEAQRHGGRDWTTLLNKREADTSFAASATPGALWIGARVKGTVRFGETTIHGPGTYDGVSGFAVLARVADPEANRPRLGLRRTADGLEASWPATGNGYVLETTDRLDPATWTAVPGTPAIEGDQQLVRLEADSGARFFRLRKP